MNRVMNNNFDLDNVNKRMPYSVPSADFFKQMAKNIWNEVKEDYLVGNAHMQVMQNESFNANKHDRKIKLQFIIKQAIAIAVCAALVFIVDISLPRKSNVVSLSDVDQAFNQLSTDDQTYLLNVYQDDVFIDE